jgi:hypothetical protein
MSTRTFENTNTTVLSKVSKDGEVLPVAVYLPSVDTTGSVVCTQSGTVTNPMVNCILPLPSQDLETTPKNGDLCLISSGISSTCLFPPTVANQCLGQIETGTDGSGGVSYACTNIMAKFPPKDVCSKATCENQSTDSMELINVDQYDGTNLPCYCQIGIKRNCAPGTVFSETDRVCVFPG